MYYSICIFPRNYITTSEWHCYDVPHHLGDLSNIH